MPLSNAEVLLVTFHTEEYVYLSVTVRPSGTASDRNLQILASLAIKLYIFNDIWTRTRSDCGTIG